MYKPPSDDEQQDGERAEEENGGNPPAYPRQNAAQRRAAAQSRRPFYADEHPEIPRIRRASLKQTRAEILPVSEHGLENDDLPDPQAGETRMRPRTSSQRRPYTPPRETAPRLPAQRKRSEIPPFTGLEDNYSDEQPQQETGPQARLPQRHKHREMLPFTGLEPYREEEKGRAPRKQNQRGMATRPVNAKTPLRRPARVRHASAPFWKRRKTWLLLGLLALLVLVASPILTGIVHNVTSQQSNPATTSSISISRLQNVPSNPHELLIVPPQSSHPTPPVLATSAYLLDTDNETTLYAQNPFLHLPMLSTTKLMTASLAVQMGNLDQQITITPAMEHDINQLSADSALFGVKQGETYTLRDLLYGLLYFSGNDAALVIADALAGNAQNFVAKMNQKAQDLGLRDTHFVNPHGLLDPGQYSCARDLAVLGQYSLSIPILQQISSGKVYHIAAGGKHGARVLLNENQFLWWYPGVTGGKTGYDGASDFVQVMQVTRNHKRMIGVVMHTVDWWTDMRDLMDYGAQDYTWASPRDVDNSGQPIPYDNLWNYFAKDKQDVSVPTADGGRYYVYSGYSTDGPILPYFDKNGGLKKFGFPTNMPVPSGSRLISQQFQHGAILCDLSTKQCRTT